MINKKHLLIIISIIICAMSNSSFLLANSYDKVNIDSITDYYDYLDMVGAIKSSDNIGPGDNIINQKENTKDNPNQTNNTNQFYVISKAIATDMDNNEINGELLTDGFNTKFSYTDKNDKEQNIKGFVALSIATGQKGWYHFDKNGYMSLGLFHDKNDTYYFIENGFNKGMMATGTIELDGKIYVFSDTEGPDYGKLIQ